MANKEATEAETMPFGATKARKNFLPPVHAAIPGTDSNANRTHDKHQHQNGEKRCPNPGQKILAIDKSARQDHKKNRNA